MELFARIRRDAKVEELSIRELARRHGVARATVLAVASFYLVQWARWDLVNGHTAAYNLFWVIGGAAACAVIALIASFIARTPSMLGSYGGQLLRSFRRHMRCTC